jgi:hypothetical protein
VPPVGSPLDLPSILSDFFLFLLLDWIIQCDCASVS